MKIYKLIYLLLGLASVNFNNVETVRDKPVYLYKILSMDDWVKSQDYDFIHVPKSDARFIHLAKKDQLDEIRAKYWQDVPEYVVLKLKTVKLSGRLVLEANPGGTNKYYHLYDGGIPTDAIAKVEKWIQ